MSAQANPPGGEGLLSALKAVVVAWEALQGNQYYSPGKVEAWISDDMAPAIHEARAAILRATARTGATDAL